MEKVLILVFWINWLLFKRFGSFLIQPKGKTSFCSLKQAMLALELISHRYGILCFHWNFEMKLVLTSFEILSLQCKLITFLSQSVFKGSRLLFYQTTCPTCSSFTCSLNTIHISLSASINIPALSNKCSLIWLLCNDLLILSKLIIPRKSGGCKIQPVNVYFLDFPV